jgi:hypothetical protein
MTSVLVKKQVKKFGPKSFTENGERRSITATVRYDDECGNGHNSFAITGEIHGPRGFESVGCIHEEIAKHFPDLAPLIKWHLCSSDGPLHYVANVVYHASNRDHWGLLKGEASASPRHQKHVVMFGNSPIEHEVSPRLKKFIDETLAADGEFVLDRMTHVMGGKEYYKYQFAGMDCKWHECPFDTESECRQWIDAVTGCELHWSSRPTLFGEGKERDLDAARSVGIWPDATDDELMQDRETLTAALQARLPGLLVEFRAAVESLGFTF